MISVQQMHYILVLSEQLHFQRASELCFVTQPTLSMQVKKAESALGYAIFDRSKSKLLLTEFGQQIIPIIRELLNEMDKIEVLKKKMGGTYKEQIRIAIIPTVAAYFVPRMFSIWNERIENVSIQIEEKKTTELLEALQRREFDIGILAGPHVDSSLRKIHLYNEEIMVYAPHVKKSKITSDDLQGAQPWLLSHGNCLRTQMIEFCQLSNEETTQGWNYEGGNIDLLLKMVDLHGGYSLVPEFYEISAMQRKKLSRIYTKEENENPGREIIALVPNRSMKWESIEKMLRSVQLEFGHEQKKGIKILDWKSR